MFKTFLTKIRLTHYRRISTYNCTYGLNLFLRSNYCKKLTLTVLTHKSPKHTIVSIEINHILHKLNH